MKELPKYWVLLKDKMQWVWISCSLPEDVETVVISLPAMNPGPLVFIPVIMWTCVAAFPYVYSSVTLSHPLSFASFLSNLHFTPLELFWMRLLSSLIIMFSNDISICFPFHEALFWKQDLTSPFVFSHQPRITLCMNLIDLLHLYRMWLLWLCLCSVYLFVC